MGSFRFQGRLATFCLAVLAPGLLAAPGQPEPPADAAALSQRIDQLIEAGYKARDVKPAPLCDDAEFLRRVYLDLTGRIPPVAEVHKFLRSKAPDKRRVLVEELLASPTFINHFANVWRATILPPGNNQQAQFFSQQMEVWLRRRLRDDVSYDKMVRELLTSNLANQGAAMQRAQLGVVDANPNVFFQLNEFKAENIAASTARLFLGVKLECAQCHDHPFAKWNKKQFWELAAFFTEFQTPQGRRPVPQPGNQAVKPEIKIPGTNKVVQARFLDGTEPQFQPGNSPRISLAGWLTTAENPFFARAAVNRYWDHFFGTGLIEPVDEMGDENPASHPELLDELAQAFAQKGFDQKFLIRAIIGSKTYQLTSASRAAGHEDPRLFARMALKGLTPEQLFDSLCQATGYRDQTAGQVRLRGFNQFGSPRAEFLARFANSADKKTEHQTSILQALALMNGQFIADATSLDRSQTLAAVLESPFLDNRQRLDTLFMSALSRPMRDEEIARLVPYVEEGGPSKDSRKALADVFWVLLNNSEFSLNH